MAVSTESWITPMTKPMPTTCMATSLPMPNRLQASGISSKLPPATPEAPQADTAESAPKMTAVPKPTSTPMVCAAIIAIKEMVTAAPPMLMVAPKGMDTE